MTWSARKALEGVKLDNGIARVNTLMHLIREAQDFGGGNKRLDDALNLHRLRVQALIELRRLEGLVRRTH
jgi:hypothetical protein